MEADGEAELDASEQRCVGVLEHVRILAQATVAGTLPRNYCQHDRPADAR